MSEVPNPRYQHKNTHKTHTHTHLAYITWGTKTAQCHDDDYDDDDDDNDAIDDNDVVQCGSKPSKQSSA